MEQIILVVHLLIALSIIGLIMMQRGKGADIGASFGAGASQTLFGSAGSANVLTRGTAWLTAAFFATSFGLAMIADSRTAGEEDLGFELPFEATVDAPVIQEQDAPAEIPAGDMPEVSVQATGAEASDLPAVDAPSDEVGSESGEETPEK